MPEVLIGAATAGVILLAALRLSLREKRSKEDALERAWTVVRRMNEGPEQNR